jgi:DNA-binding CsgD family transcriptional regulator
VALRAAKDLRSVLDYTTDLLQVGHYGQVLPVMLSRLAEVVGCERATLTHLDMQTQHEVALCWPAASAIPAHLDRYPFVGNAHPLRAPLNRLAGSGGVEPTAVRISDMLSARAWRQTAIYREAMLGVSDQLCLPLAFRGPVVHAVTLTRHGGSFSNAQRERLEAVGPHLRALRRRISPADELGLQLSPVSEWVPLSRAPGFQPKRQTPRGSLSARERQVLALVADGHTDAQIAGRLAIASSTVSRHLHRIYSRHQLANRAAAVALLRQAS